MLQAQFCSTTTYTSQFTEKGKVKENWTNSGKPKYSKPKGEVHF